MSPDPAGQIESLAAEVVEAFEFLAGRFGPPPLKTLAVSPIPGTFGQGFPGLIYLSTLAYLHPRDRPQFANQGLAFRRGNVASDRALVSDQASSR